MEALQNFLQKWLMPIATKIEKQQHLQAIKDGMIGATPFIIVGSMCLLPMAFMNLIGSGPVYDFLGVVNPFFTTIAAKTTDFGPSTRATSSRARWPSATTSTTPCSPSRPSPYCSSLRVWT